jgi:hypothetical protein
MKRRYALFAVMAIALIIIAVLITSTVWYVAVANQNIFSQKNLNSTPNPTATPTLSSTSTPTASPVSIVPPKPSVPEFTVEFVDYSTDVPPIYGVDPYTGKSVIIADGYHSDNRSMRFTVKNQPFSVYTDGSGNNITLYYNYRFKGHSEDKWSYYPYDAENNYSTSYAIPRNASQSDYTTITLALTTYGLKDVPARGQIDFQVEALIGYEKQIPVNFLGKQGYYYEFIGETSGWSQTLTQTCPYG